MNIGNSWKVLALLLAASIARAEPPPKSGWLWATAYEIPPHTSNQSSGYFSIIEGKNDRLYIGTAKYGVNAYLVEFNPSDAQMRVVVDAHRLIGATATGFAAQSKIHTRNNVGPSGKIYFATKQGYPAAGESRDLYPGGYSMVYDPQDGQCRVYGIPIPHQGIISITPDESRGVAYVSTCSDGRPIESTHFMVLDLAHGTYRDLMDCRHSYAFIVVDDQGRAYHPICGGDIARYDPRHERVDRLTQTIDGKPPAKGSFLAEPESHPINWDITPDRKTLYSLPMSGNQLYAYELRGDGTTLAGRSVGKLLPEANRTDCRAMCVGPKGDVWAVVLGTFPDVGDRMHLVSYHPGDPAPVDRGALAIRNPEYSPVADAAGKPVPFHHGLRKAADGIVTPLYHMGICQAHDGAVYATVICPFSVLKVEFPNKK